MSRLLWGAALPVAILTLLFLYGRRAWPATRNRFPDHDFWFVQIPLAQPRDKFAAGCCCGWRGRFAYAPFQQAAAQAEYRRHLAERAR